MGLFSKQFEKEERDFLKQIGDRLTIEEISQIRTKYEYNFNSNRDNFNEFKKEVLKKIKIEKGE